MKKISAILLFMLFAIGILPISVFAADSLVIATQNVTAAPGEIVCAEVDIKENSGFCYLKLHYYYNAEMLEFIEVENGVVSTDGFTLAPQTIVWDTAENAVSDGTLCTLVFKVKSNAVVGEYPITLAVVECFDYNESVVTATVSHGAVTVKAAAQHDILLGDVDGDGSVTAADARLALRCAVKLEHYAPVSREFIACDVNNDRAVTAADARAILRASVQLETLPVV